MKKPEHNTCHGCGLAGEELYSLEPCRSCVRNPQVKDYWDPELKRVYPEIEGANR